MSRKNTIRFLVAYLIFAFLGIFTLATFSSDLMHETLLEHRAEAMHREGTVLASRYGNEAFDEETQRFTLERELDPYATFLHSSVWIISHDGSVVAASGQGYVGTAPDTVADFDPVDSTAPSYQVGNFYGSLGQEVLTISCPITNGFRILGYVIIHEPTSQVTALQQSMTRIGLLSFGIIFLFSLIFILIYFFFIQRPLQKILQGSKEYAAGNLGYQIVYDRNDEIGNLAASLNDMSGRLNESEETQRKFIANVSHDFRSPLTSIRGYVQAIQDGTIPPDKMDRYLKIISFETDRLTDLTEDLLTLSRYDLKGMKLSRTSFDINELIKSTAASFEGRCVNNRIEIELIFADFNTEVYADRPKIQQVVYNLLDNAIKFSPDDSIITIETTKSGSKLRISVKDHGSGISKNDLPKIWDRFYKSDASRGQDKKGTGLGLSIVKETIQAHDETISVISTEGAGTEFIFTLALTGDK